MKARVRGAQVPAARSSVWSALALAAAACGEAVGPEEGELIPPLHVLDYAAVAPAVSYELWELRESSASGEHIVIGSGGSLTRGEIDPDVLAAFDATAVPSGFGPGCLPGDCFRYVATLLGSEVETARTPEELATFLGPIGSAEEAALLVSAHGYYWGRERRTASVREVADGYELVVLRTVAFCDPVQIDRFVLRVSTSGQLTVRDSEVWERESGACI